jgi:2-hydroxychromene-2-carboxylate isomerase
MSKQLEFFYDYASPFSYVASVQVRALAERTGAELVRRPILLGGLFQATGNSPPVGVPAKAAYMAKDIERWSQRLGVDVKMNPHFPVNTVTALRGALATLADGGYDAYDDAVFQAIWQEGVNPADKAVLGEVIARAGLDAEKILARCGDDEIKGQLRANTEEAESRGAFGVPTFFVEGEMFFGNDHMDFVEEALG